LLSLPGALATVAWMPGPVTEAKPVRADAGEPRLRRLRCGLGAGEVALEGELVALLLGELPLELGHGLAPQVDLVDQAGPARLVDRCVARGLDGGHGHEEPEGQQHDGRRTSWDASLGRVLAGGTLPGRHVLVVGV
jgi:hypothetical protein